MELITRDCDIFDPKSLPGWRAVLCSRQTERSWLYQYDFTVPRCLLCLGLWVTVCKEQRVSWYLSCCSLCPYNTTFNCESRQHTRLVAGMVAVGVRALHPWLCYRVVTSSKKHLAGSREQ